jgi:hypothetical protein
MLKGKGENNTSIEFQYQHECASKSKLGNTIDATGKGRKQCFNRISVPSLGSNYERIFFPIVVDSG